MALDESSLIIQVENCSKMKNTLFRISLGLLLLTLSSCLRNDELNISYEGYQPIDLQDGLTISTPENENIDADILNEIYQDVYHEDDLWSLRSLLVFRNDQLVAESYLKDKNDITAKHLIWSCTKQVMGILTGIALEEGLIKNFNDPISEYFDFELEDHQDKKDITIKNLVTMRSGIDYNNDGVNGETDKLLRQIPENSIDFVLSRPIWAPQGTEFHYNDGDPHLMSALIQKVSGKTTRDWAEDVFFSKLGMTNYNWVTYKDGVTMGGFGIETTPREMAKIALCVYNNGVANGEQLISRDWVDAMTSVQVNLEDSDYSFGYYWWLDESRSIHFMWGHGGQFAFIAPEKDLVIVMTSIPNTQGDYQILADEALKVVDRIIQASL